GLTRDMVSMQGLGYKEMLDYMDGTCTLEEAIEALKVGTRHYAKRQITWFKREKEAVWIDRQAFDRDDLKTAKHIQKLFEEGRLKTHE
ncbi:MAG: tRNA (adenosine(37)-N6)-dimethylallyltransferase MiaA, partial [Lachnospiraceae bacterium]|nr:tRNA (adenosine(37)-N6)-dimethylallyltransferase MiaA [Candidatus Equihabitans merdae]